MYHSCKLLAFILIIASVSAFAQQPRGIPKEIRDQLLVNEQGACADERSLKATWVDLNGDRIPELIVKIANSCHCGASGNCSTIVFQKMEVGWVQLFEPESSTSLYPKLTSTNGFKDLVSEGAFGAATAFLTVYKWDGRKYDIDSCWHKDNIGTRQGKTVWRTTPVSCTQEEPANKQSPIVQNQFQNQPPQYQRSAQALTPRAFVVPAGRYTFFRIIVNRNGTIIGRFSASGGNGNDVEVFILGQDEFINFQNGHSVRTWYNSGRVTVSNISVSLSPGNYYLVFNNKFSVITPKAITASILLAQ